MQSRFQAMQWSNDFAFLHSPPPVYQQEAASALRPAVSHERVARHSNISGSTAKRSYQPALGRSNGTSIRRMT
jgi:hypothetical protein